MKYKVAELEGALLDAAVAKAEGWIDNPGGGFHAPTLIDVGEDKPLLGTAWEAQARRWSTDWQHGGPIIERERIATVMLDGVWHAWVPTVTARASEYDPDYWLFEETSNSSDAKGPTLLIAAMRAFVASKFGEEVEL